MTDRLAATEEGIGLAAAILRDGGLVAFPTDTVYGVACAVSRSEAVMAIFALKRRPAERQIPLLVGGVEDIAPDEWVVDERVRALAARFWPGPLTIILVAPRRGTLAFRVPDHALARRLIAASGGGLPVTSANRSGERDAQTAEEVMAQLDGRIALVLDGGRTPGGVSSTIVDCTGEKVKIVREGAISEDEISQVLATVA